MAALAVQRTIESTAGITLKRIVKLLRPIRSGSVIIAGKEYPAGSKIPDDVKPLLKKLNQTH